MRVLLDTHLVLWSMARSRRLPRAARAIILDESNEVFFSAASVWEVAIKSALGRSSFRVDPVALVQALSRSGFAELPVTSAHAVRVAKLPAVHRDPFDRLLIAQSLAEPLTLVTNDVQLAKYGSFVMLV